MTRRDSKAGCLSEPCRFYVNLSASQVRKRLKGHGLGVKKVESAGRNQAAVLHTATGQHLRELRALLADVMPSDSQEELDVPVENLRNLGMTSAMWLRDIDVHNRAELVRLGPVLAYRLVKQRRPDTTVNLLWALAGALADKDWRTLSAEEKAHLRCEAEDR